MYISNILKVVSITILLLSNVSFASDYPKSMEERRLEKMGSLTDGGIVFKPFHARNDETTSGNKNSVKVNKYLWDAARIILKFMPPSTIDYSNGIIVTDWYSSEEEPNYSFKIETIIKDDIISPSSIEVNIYEKKLKNGRWYNQPASEKLSAKFTDQIIRKARELYIQSK